MSTGPIEAKVKWASTAAAFLTVLVTLANSADLIPGYEHAPPWVKALVSVVIITGGTFGAGRAAPHTFRSDKDALAARKIAGASAAPRLHRKVSPRLPHDD